MYIKFWVCIIASCCILACANIGNPTGGHKDVDPPYPVKSNPLPNQLNFKGKKITIDFNENLLLNKAADKVYLSPPMNSPLIVKAYGKRITVEMPENEDYQPNTTYTIDFGNAIQDNNEKNPMGEYSFAFSTDSIIDSLQISGYVIYADNLDPAENIYVGIYKNKNDSAFRKTVPLRIGKTNEEGYFCIRNVSSGTYRIVALKDANQNYKFDQKSEFLSFSEEDIIPTIAQVMLPDTVWKDSITVDTIVDKLTDVYSPFNILLPLFQETDSSCYFDKAERKIRQRIDLLYTGILSKLPTIEPLNFVAPKNWYLLETSSNKDTLNYWITDSAIYNLDTIRFALHHWKLDSNQIMQPAIDTMSLMFKSTEKKRKKKDQDKPLPVELLKLSTNATGAFNQFDTILLTSPSPIRSVNKASICLEEQKDSTKMDIPIKIVKKDDRNYFAIAKLTSGKKYFFRLDSAAVYNIYGLTNTDLESAFNIRTIETYASLEVNLKNAPKNFRVQLVNSSDLVVYEEAPKGEKASFTYLEPGDYYLRGYVDANKNKKWDTGNYQLKLQPEEVIYHQKKITLKVNWEVSEDWDINEFQTLEQKNKDLKNKIKREGDKDKKEN